MSGFVTADPSTAADRRYMARAVELAERGAGAVHPNPLVGALVVRGDRVVGEGFHAAFGGPHAEVHALAEAGEEARGATLYVTLEPCAHTGKTPPCVEAILGAGIARVCFATLDPNPAVRGRGADRLRAAGVAVTAGVSSPAAVAINRPYFFHRATGRPLVTLKVAATLDGRIAAAGGEARWISGEAARAAVHALRARADAVVVGAETVRRDDPALTVRHVTGRHPVRVVFEGRTPLPAHARLLTDGAARTVRVTTRPSADADAWTVPAEASGRPDPARFLALAEREGWRHLLLEGGGRLASSFLRSDLVDELLLVTAPLVLGSEGTVPWAGDVGSPTLTGARRFRIVDVTRLGEDVRLTLHTPRLEDACSPAS